MRTELCGHILVEMAGCRGAGQCWWLGVSRHLVEHHFQEHLQQARGELPPASCSFEGDGR